MQPAIRVDNLSKCYRINHAIAGRGNYRTLRESVAGVIQAPFKRWASRGNESARNEDFWALKDVSFDVKPGEVVGIIGRNGAGKSTLLKILSRITKPSGGHVALHGRVGSLLEVGTGFHPELTGRENVYLNGSILGMSRQEIERQFDAIVDFSGVEKFLDTPVKRYSSGMYVRLAFAVAAHLEPEILVVDEVLAVGDVQFQKRCLGKMKDVSSDGRTVLFVSHNMAAVRQLTTRAIVLSEGRIAWQGNVESAIECYERTGIEAESGVYDATQLARPRFDMTGEVRFVRLWIDEKRLRTFAADADIEFFVRLRAEQTAPRFRISLTLFRNDCVPVGSVFSDGSLALAAGEERDFKVTIPNPRLAPGRYHVGISVGTGSNATGHRDYDILLDVLHFAVLPPAGEEGTQASWVAGWGAIRFPELVCQ
jgi:lipopolysaccharide transport system ATP-binding protein